MVRLKQFYRDKVIDEMLKKFKYQNRYQVPRLEKVVINMGLGEAIVNPKAMESAISDLSTITGQKPVITKAKQSIAAFKIRTGMKIGIKVTLRGDRMYVFLDKLFNAVFPRIRDFRGISPKSFDGHGNFAVGLKEQIVFPEIDYDQIDKVRGMDVIVVTTAKSDEEAAYFLKQMGCPFKEK